MLTVSESGHSRLVSGFRGDLAFSVNDDFPGAGWNGGGCHLAAWPTDDERVVVGTSADHLHGAVLRPITRACLNFTQGTGFGSILPPELRSHGRRVPGGAFETNSQSRLALLVLQKSRGVSILGDGQVDPSIAVEVPDSRSPLIPVDFDPGVISGNGSKNPVAGPQQQQAASRIVGGFEAARG